MGNEGTKVPKPVSQEYILLFESSRKLQKKLREKKES